MALYFQNGLTNRTVSVAIVYSWPNCPDGDNWAKKGWWMIPPGQKAGQSGWSLKRREGPPARRIRHRCVQWGGEFVTNLPDQRLRLAPAHFEHEQHPTRHEEAHRAGDQCE